MNQDIKKQRNSSLELLRIICMFMIIAHHYVLHGDFTFNYENNMLATIYLKCISGFGKAACSIFALITGYYMIEVDTQSKFYRRIIPTLFQISFCLFIVFIIDSFFSFQVKWSELIHVLFPYAYCGWYASAYVCFFFFIPYINKLIICLEKKQLKKLLLLIYVIYFIVNTIVFNRFSFGNLYFMFIMYLFGAYNKLYGKERNNKKNLLYSVTAGLFILLSNVVIVVLGYKTKLQLFLLEDNPFISFSNIFTFAFSYYLFVFFTKKYYNLKIINSIASTTLSIYLIHDSEELYQYIWSGVFANANYINNPYIHSITKISLVFATCMVIDLVRQLTIHKLFVRYVYPYIDNKLDIFTNIINNRIGD